MYLSDSRPAPVSGRVALSTLDTKVTRKVLTPTRKRFPVRKPRSLDPLFTPREGLGFRIPYFLSSDTTRTPQNRGVSVQPKTSLLPSPTVCLHLSAPRQDTEDHEVGEGGVGFVIRGGREGPRWDPLLGPTTGGVTLPTGRVRDVPRPSGVFRLVTELPVDDPMSHLTDPGSGSGPARTRVVSRGRPGVDPGIVRPTPTSV